MRNWLACIVIGLLAISCYKIEEYPDTPEIEFLNFSLTDTVDALDNPIMSGTLRFRFVDGDGDIGHSEPPDTSQAEESKNLFISLYQKIDGEYIEQDMSVPYSYRIPYFETSGNNRTLKGEIKVSDINFNPPYEGDTIKFSFFIKDRAGHSSNVEETGAYVLADYQDTTAL